MTGYRVGPVLAPDEDPFSNAGVPSWEQDPAIDDGHAHTWESVLLQADGRRRSRMEEGVRCSSCHAPRCGHSTDPDPCMLRRHHAVSHVTLAGRVVPKGGPWS